jgi:hypothetical protein
MKLLRSATLSVSSLSRAAANYMQWLDYSAVEHGVLPADLAASWGCPGSAGAPYTILQPSSGADVFLRLVEAEPHPDYVPLRTYGWAAIEICVSDVLKVAERMERSPFEIIGPPREIEGLPAIFPMQVKGEDNEIVYLTQIRDDLPAYNLPRAASLIDKLFILVMACSDMRASNRWMETHAGMTMGREMDIVYTMIANAFGSPMDELHTISTMINEKDVFLELDQYPAAATPRPSFAGKLPPGISIGTFLHPDFKSLPGPWISPPVRRDGALYAGRLTGTMRDPDGTLVEMIEA